MAGVKISFTDFVMRRLSLKKKNSGNQPEFNHQSKNEQLLNCKCFKYFYLSMYAISERQNTNLIQKDEF